jgi:hypothetical protein
MLGFECCRRFAADRTAIQIILLCTVLERVARADDAARNGGYLRAQDR